MLLACLFVFAYIVGAVPFGVLITRAKGIDIRKVGSGNIGATNVARAVGPAWAGLVFLLDLSKGFVPAMVAKSWPVMSGNSGASSQALPEWVWYAAGVAAIAGHCASPFLGFKGGKGIATSLGMVFGASPIVAAGGFCVFLVLFATTRFVSLSSIAGVAASVVLGAILRDWTYVGIGSLLFLFVLYTHRANICRLRDGTEPKFGFRRKEPKDDENDGGLAMAAHVPAGPTPIKGVAANDPPLGGLP